MKEYTFEEYLLLSEHEKKDLEHDIKHRLEVLNSFEKKEQELKSKENLSKFEKEIIELYKKSDIRFYNYENFSVNNYFHRIGPSYSKDVDMGWVAFFSEIELPAIEEYGLASLMKNCFYNYSKFDIRMDIYKGRYSKKNDYVMPTYSDVPFDKNKACLYCLSKLDSPRLALKNNMYVYYLHYKSSYRENNSLLWKKMNPRKFECYLHFEM